MTKGKDDSLEEVHHPIRFSTFWFAHLARRHLEVPLCKEAEADAEPNAAVRLKPRKAIVIEVWIGRVSNGNFVRLSSCPNRCSLADGRQQRPIPRFPRRPQSECRLSPDRRETRRGT